MTQETAKTPALIAYAVRTNVSVKSTTPLL